MVDGHIEPVTVAVVGDKAADNIPSGTIAVTPNSLPNVVVKVVSPLVAVLIRFLNLYLSTLIGILTLRMVPAGDNMVVQTIQAIDFYHLIVTAGSIAFAPAIFGFLKDCITILTGLEKKYPLSTGSV